MSCLATLWVVFRAVMLDRLLPWFDTPPEPKSVETQGASSVLPDTGWRGRRKKGGWRHAP